MVTRQDVYAAIDSERAYQEFRWGVSACDGRTPEDHQHSATEWLAYMLSYVNEGLEQVSRNADPKASQLAIPTIRKIAAMGVAAMEQLGAPRREGY